jgi:hypothetical protein
VFASQTISDSTQSVQWAHRDVSGASFRMTNASGQGDGESAELDAMGANAGLFKPPVGNPPNKEGLLIPPLEFGDINSPGGGCVVDGIVTPCSIASGGATVQCPDNICGGYNAIQNGFVHFQAYADGYSDYLPSDARYRGNGLAYSHSRAAAAGNHGGWIDELAGLITLEQTQQNIDYTFGLGDPPRMTQERISFDQAVEATRNILQANNDCSRFFGGAGLDALNGIARTANAAGNNAFQQFNGDFRTGISMGVPSVVAPGDAPIVTTDSYAAVSPTSVTINTNGPFIRRAAAGNQTLPRYGGYAPGSLQSRVVQLLHETGHVVITRVSSTIFFRGNRFYPMERLTHLLPLDGNNATLSEQNTDAILAACRQQIDALR